MNANAASFMPRQLPDLPLIFPDQETIRQKASELNLEWNSTLEYVTGLSDGKLRRLFGKLYKGPREKFTNYYEISKNHFNSYMRGSVHKKSRSSIQKWLLYSAQLDHLIEKEVINISYHKSSSVHELCESIISVKDDINHICFLDGDNSPSSVEKLSEIKGLYLICYKLLGTYVKGIHRWNNSPFFSIRYTLQQGKDAADVLMCMDVSFLHLLLPPDLPFSVISEDDFTIELDANIQQLGRKCKRISPRIRSLRIYFHLLNESELWSDITQNPIDVARKLKQESAERSSSALSAFKDLSRVFWKGNRDFRKVIKEANVIDIAVELVHLGLPIPKTDENGTELDLRIQWKMKCKTTETVFLQQYNLSQREFYAYIKGGDDENVKSAIRDFLLRKI